ncbi:MAG: sigma-70 family RNA polymerase sigma factor [Acidobacteriota bacterium]
MKPNANEMTKLLEDWNAGDSSALEHLMEAAFSELHHLAQAYFRREPSGHTLQPTALVNELYLRLLGQERISWQNRAQFLGVAGQLMRRILVDHFRHRRASKRGGDLDRVTLTEAKILGGSVDFDVLAIDEALTELQELDVQEAKIVELRFFAGLTIEEIAAALGISPATVKRDWASAKAWLWQRLHKP